MMARRKHTSSPARSILFVFLGLICLTVFLGVLLRGNDIALLNPKGYVAESEFRLMMFAVALLLTAAVPTIVLLYGFAWHYRESNHRAVYDPKAKQGRKFIVAIWAIPSIFVLTLALVTWPATHKLEPQKPLATDAKPLTIQVIAMRWKWLFIYPEQDIASVNFVNIPVDTPVRFELTADETPMSSFWIPHLSGQLYAMTGHVNPLNLITDTPGDYPGSSAEINGAGFAGMKFTARAGTAADFNAWVKEAKSSTNALDAAAYDRLLVPSENHKVTLYGSVQEGLYAKMLMKYAGSHDHQPQTYEGQH